MRKTIDVTKKPSRAQIELLTKAAVLPIHAESEYPEFTVAELRQFRRISDARKVNRKKQTVTLRLSPQALEKARSLGKGYTSVLSRILERALDDPDVIKQNL